MLHILLAHTLPCEQSKVSSLGDNVSATKSCRIGANPRFQSQRGMRPWEGSEARRRLHG